ncbi:MAG: sulfurtransferase [Acidimicrobiales bacterium]
MSDAIPGEPDLTMPPPIVTPTWVIDQLVSAGMGLGRVVRLVDTRAYLDGRDGHEAYRAEHIPGAVWVDLDTVLAGPPSAAGGRHPLPDPQTFADGLAEAGVGFDDLVVAYDDLGGMVAGRLVWMLRLIGAPAALLDGGLAGWPGPRESGEVDLEPAPARPAVPWPADRIVDAAGVQAHLAAGGVVVDARAADRYRGEHEPIDARAGHIPGAVNLPFADNLDDDGRFRSVDERERRFAPVVGSDPAPVFYCGSGVSACHDLLALESTGLTGARLYVGSWSQWSADPDRPVATGDEPDRP